MIPQCNPKAGYLAHKAEIDAAIGRVLDSGWYILGQEVGAFEQEFSDWLGLKNTVGVANGTDAIELALRSLGVGVGDQVATVSHTAVATVAAIGRTGAEPRFVDIEPDYFTMCPNSFADVLENSSGIKAVVVVHLYGQMADMPRILELAHEYGLPVIEDCAQAHGAVLNGRKAGGWGNLGTFSFYPTKNLGALGDGGAVTTKDDETAGQLKALRQYGWDETRSSSIEGVNSRLDELQAAVLRVKLAHLNDDNSARKRIAKAYYKGLFDIEGVVVPAIREGAGHVYHQFVLRSQKQNELCKHLHHSGVGHAIHYPQPVHMMPAYDNKEYAPVPLTHTEKSVTEILSLPMFPELDEESQDQIIASVRRL